MSAASPPSKSDPHDANRQRLPFRPTEVVGRPFFRGESSPALFYLFTLRFSLMSRAPHSPQQLTSGSRGGENIDNVGGYDRKNSIHGAPRGEIDRKEQQYNSVAWTTCRKHTPVCGRGELQRRLALFVGVNSPTVVSRRGLKIAPQTSTSLETSKSVLSRPVEKEVLHRCSRRCRLCLRSLSTRDHLVDGVVVWRLGSPQFLCARMV